MMAIAQHRATLMRAFEAAVPHPRACLARHLPPAPADGRLVILVAGAQARAAEA